MPLRARQARLFTLAVALLACPKSKDVIVRVHFGG